MRRCFRLFIIPAHSLLICTPGSNRSASKHRCRNCRSRTNQAKSLPSLHCIQGLWVQSLHQQLPPLLLCSEIWPLYVWNQLKCPRDRFTCHNFRMLIVAFSGIVVRNKKACCIVPLSENNQHQHRRDEVGGVTVTVLKCSLTPQQFANNINYYSLKNTHMMLF